MGAMTKQEAVEYFGTATALAAALGCANSTVSEWVTIPDGRQYQLELATNGVLKADKIANRADYKKAAA